MLVDVNNKSKTPSSIIFLDLRKKPSRKTYVFAGDTLNLTCVMRIDTIYPKRAITWKVNGTNDQVIQV